MCSLELLTPWRDNLSCGSCKTSPEKPQAQRTTSQAEDKYVTHARRIHLKILMQRTSFLLHLRQGGEMHSSRFSPKSESNFGSRWLLMPQLGSEFTQCFYGEE